MAMAAMATLAAAGCSEEPRADQPPTTTSTATSTDTTTSSPEDLRAVCETVDAAVSDKLLDEALAVGTNEPGVAMRADVSAAYAALARDLIDIALRGEVDPPAELVPVLLDWAGAVTEVSTFVATNEPGPGLVIDYGPAQPRELEAEKAAEDLCGHPLPNN